MLAGVDCVFFADGKQCLPAVVLWGRQTQQVVEQQTAVLKVEFAYIPGLLSFREVPVMLAALAKLSVRPEAVSVMTMASRIPVA